MKESIGATWIFTICVTFIVLFTAYIAISVNYAKAFRLKSHIVSEIEEHDGISGLEQQDIETYLTAQGYSTKGECPENIEVDGQETGWSIEWCLLGDDKGNCGACVYQKEVETGNDNFDGGNTKRYYYRVTTFFKFDLPVVNVVLPPFGVSGDTQYIME